MSNFKYVISSAENGWIFEATRIDNGNRIAIYIVKEISEILDLIKKIENEHKK